MRRGIQVGEKAEKVFIENYLRNKDLDNYINHIRVRKEKQETDTCGSVSKSPMRPRVIPNCFVINK